MKKHASKFTIEMMAKILRVSRAGYYQYCNRKISATAQYDEVLTKKIKLIYDANIFCNAILETG